MDFFRRQKCAPSYDDGKFSFPVLFFGIITVVALFIGKFFYRPEREKLEEKKAG